MSTGDEFTFPTRVGRWTRLRVVTPSDYEYLYGLASTPETSIRWRFRGSTPRFEEFVASLWHETLAVFLIESRERGEPIGLVSAYRPDFRNQTAYLNVLISPVHRRSGWPLEGVLLFLELLFVNWPFRKVYLEAVEFNYRLLASGAGRLFEPESVLKDYEYFDGRYWDLVTASVSRAAVEGHVAKLLGRT
jgi:RimJ/RimL family protein N-acetyltransferase